MYIHFDYSKPIILIDASYYVFYRYFATLRWFIFQKKEYDVSTLIENQEYVSKFKNHMRSDIEKLCKKWVTISENIVFCTDCQRCNIWRNDIYPEYKGTRHSNDNFNSNIFGVFDSILNELSLKKIAFDRLEADDIVYLLQTKLKQKTKIVIISNDNDYLQLADDNTDIYNMQNKDITQRGLLDSKTDLYYKVIFGDKSDNILKLSQNITKDKAIEISKMKEKDIIRWVKNENLKQQFDLNLQLVSFEKIPKKIKTNFYNAFELK